MLRENPVFTNELRQSAFRRRKGIVISVWIGVMLFTCLLAQVDRMDRVVLYAPLFLLPLLVPAIASGAFAKEYEQQTWQDIFLTRLTNLQVVLGKFFAFFLLVGIGMLSTIPSFVVLAFNRYYSHQMPAGFDLMPVKWQITLVQMTFVLFVRLMVSAIFFILLVMVCSRYSANRRTALIWSYLALALYIGMGVFLWQAVGSLDNDIHRHNTAAHYTYYTPYSSVNGYFAQRVADAPVEELYTIWCDELSIPGFMESFHLIFCTVVGVGSAFLLWISLSEQRGYRENTATTARTWKPMAQRLR